MTSLRLGITPHRRAAARFIGSVRRKLQKAFADSPDVTQTQIADALGVHRSVINRQFRGRADISLGRVAEIAYLLGYDPEFELVRRGLEMGSNIPLSPEGSFKSVQMVSSAGVSQIAQKEPQIEVAL